MVTVARISGRALATIIGSIVLLVAVSAARLLAGYAMGVGVLVVEGLHSLIDCVISLFILAALLLARSKRGKKYPYGLYKLEDLAALLLSLVILGELVSALSEMGNSPPELGLIPVAIQGVSVLALLGVVYLKYYAARLLNSPSMKADAAHMVADVMESGFVSLGLALYYYTLHPLSYKAALLAAVIGLAVAAYEAAHDSIKALLDIPKDPSLAREVESLVERVMGDKAKVVGVRARWAGPVIFLEVEVRVHPLQTVEAASRLARRAARLVMEEIPEVEDVRILMEPAVRDRLVVAVPVESPSMDSRVCPKFAKSPYFLIAQVAGPVITASKILRGEELLSKRTARLLLGADIAESLYERGVTDVIVVNIGEIAYSLLLRHKILVWRADPSKSAAENLALLQRGELEVLEEPTEEASWRYESRR